MHKGALEREIAKDFLQPVLNALNSVKDEKVI